MSFKGCQINLIDFNFHLQKSLEIFHKNSADEIWSKNHKEMIKVSYTQENQMNQTLLIKVDL